MDFHVSSFSALVFCGRRADAGRTSTRVFADASAYFLRASAALFWAAAAARSPSRRLARASGPRRCPSVYAAPPPRASV